MLHQLKTVRKHPHRVFLQRLLLLMILWPGVSPAAEVPDAEQALDILGIPSEELANFNRGGIIAQAVEEATEKELALDVAMFLPAPLAKVADYLNSGELETIDPDVSAYSEISPKSGVEAFKHFALTARQADEIDELLNGEPGDRFNFSAGEFDSFKSLREKLADADRKTRAEEVSQLYREILWQRWQAYRRNGLAGIATYAHEEGVADADPSSELRIGAEGNQALARYYPEMHKAWLNYPADLPSGATEQFFWINRRVENRPTAILGHRIVQASDDGAVVLIRHFYVGHSYNSIDLMIGCLPYRDGTIVFYSQRTFTDQVAGVAASLKHSIGREQMKSLMVKRLETLRRALRKASFRK